MIGFSAVGAYVGFTSPGAEYVGMGVFYVALWGMDMYLFLNAVWVSL